MDSPSENGAGCFTWISDWLLHDITCCRALTLDQGLPMDGSGPVRLTFRLETANKMNKRFVVSNNFSLCQSMAIRSINTLLPTYATFMSRFSFRSPILTRMMHWVSVLPTAI